MSVLVSKLEGEGTEWLTVKVGREEESCDLLVSSEGISARALLVEGSKDWKVLGVEKREGGEIQVRLSRNGRAGAVSLRTAKKFEIEIVRLLELELWIRLGSFVASLIGVVAILVALMKAKRMPFSIKAGFQSFCSICIRNEETKAMIAEILHAHDEQLQIHPRTKWWRLWIHGCTVVALVWHLLIKQFQQWPLRLLDQLIGVVRKFRLP